jgi:hypothetical protein
LAEKRGTYPVGALRRWLEAAAVGERCVFRRIDRHGHPTSPGIRCAPGSRRRPRAAGRSEAAIMRHERWKSVQIARRYIRQGARWDDNPAADLGL